MQQKFLHFIFLMMFCLDVFAGETICGGVPERVFTFKDGKVAVRLVETQNVYVLCDQQDLGCSSVLANILAAKAQKVHVELIFFDTTFSSCAEVPNWTDMRQEFIHVRSLP